MLLHGLVRRVARASLIGTLLVVLTATAVAAHSITVTPNGNADGFGPRPISRPWAQAHCNANSPSHIAESSNGIVQFTPADALPCPAIENRGGQVHPAAES